MKKLAHALAALGLATTSAQALDTDIYLNETKTVFPNVVFSMDTSGSMQSWYTTLLAPPDYSSSASYSGPFSNSQLYISTDGRIPSQKTGLANAPLTSFAGCNFAVSPIANDGFTAIKLAVAVNPSSNSPLPKQLWIPANKAYFSTTSNSEFVFECSDDSGVHGLNAGSSNRYASETPTGFGQGLYSSSSAQEIDWDKYSFITVYSGHYLNYKANPPASISMARGVLQNRVVRDAIKRTPDIMAGLARMYGVRGGGIIRAAKDNSVRANQQELLNLSLLDTSRIDNVYAGATPLATTLLEIMHYYHGLQINRSPDYFHGSITDGDWRSGYTGDRYFPTDPAARSGSNYVSPIQYECQKNYVVLVTDGEPSWDDGANDDFKASNSTKYPNYSTHLGKSVCDGNCLDEIAGYMSKQDAAPSLNDTFDLDGDTFPDPQTVKVYPIGMESEQDLLDDAADAAGTESYYASNATEFENAFVEILAAIKGSGGVSMVTASSSNDRFSKTSNRDYLYYGQFVPNSKFQWKGNLKKYRFAYNSDDIAYITDSNPANPDITTEEGGIITTAKSYWSSQVDGNDALKGGVVDRLKSNNSRLIRGVHSLDDTDVSIMNSSQMLTLSNIQFKNGLGIDDRSAAEQQAVVNYALGQDVHDENDNGNTSEQRGTMGGIVRSSPVAVQYGGTASSPNIVIFAATTDGVLHAFDDETGEELWAVVMREAYPNLASQHDNHFTTAPWWGIDGAISSRVIDKNNNGIIEAAQGDKVLLYVSGGMSLRRWFILDVTRARENSDQVTLKRRGRFDASRPFWEEIGLAISPMVPITYRLENDGADVFRKGMIYAQGWDPAAEFNYLNEHTMGRGLAMYDAETGKPLWHYSRRRKGGATMKYSFPTQPTPIDLDGDGYTDLFYAIDTNARIWRFNIKNGNNKTQNMITGGILAKLGTDTNTVSEQRRTYRRIDAAVINSGTGAEVLLAVGTGDRMNPTSTQTQDRIHIIRDKTASSGASPTSVVLPTDLFDATLNTIGEGSTANKQAALTDLNGKDGWYINLPSDQKSISAPLISSGIANFPIYKVGGTNTNPCEDTSAGTGLLYRVNVLDATPATDYNEDGSLSANDRFTNIRGGGIPGDVNFHTSSTGIKTILVNKDTFVNRPGTFDPFKNASPEDEFHSDSAGYWFEQ